jgi:glycosyltransferase involved in cell wall biosynthesis
MSSIPAISVVLGVYNGQRFIAAAIESILKQTFTDFEFIVVDDGSTDKTVSILQKYASQDPRLKVVQIPHGGIVDAANAGLQAARAPLIARADADDISMPERFAKQVQYMAEHPDVVCLGSRMWLMEPYGSIIDQSHHPLTHEEIDRELLRGSGWAMPQPVAMLRKEAITKIGGYRKEYLWSEDLDLFLRIAEVGRLANLPDLLIKYRSHAGSTNHRLPHVQFELSRKCIVETYQRRGLPVPADLDLMSPFENKPIDKYLQWAWAALREKNVRGARLNAWKAVREKPFFSQSWRAMYCALRGY